MLTTSYHTHNRYCDGKGEIAEYLEAAIGAGLEAVGVSSHSPLTFPNDFALRAGDLPAYCAEVEGLRKSYADRLRVHLGTEFDFIPEYASPMWEIVAPFRFEFLIGGVHFLGHDAAGVPWAFDYTRQEFERGLREIFGGDARALGAKYYRRVRHLAEWGRVAILAHLDHINRWNNDGRYFSEDELWYRDEVEATLRACARSGLIVEVNTSGWRDSSAAPHPSPWIVRRCVEMEIPLVVTADAHQPEHIAAFYAEAEAMLREAGCSATAVLREEGWRMERF